MRAFWIEESEKGVLLASGLGAGAERRQPQRAELKARQSEACRRWWVGKLTLGGGARRRLRAGQRRRSKPDWRDWFRPEGTAALAWVLGQIIAFAVGRAQWPNQSRYIDVLLVGSMINVVSAFWLFQSARIGGRPAMGRSLALAAWLAFFALSLAHPQRHLRNFIDERRDIAIAEEKNLRRYLATGDALWAPRRYKSHITILSS
jgi:hypothetical protein